MRFEGERKHYQAKLGKDISDRTWDRIILDLDLENCPILERRDRLTLLANIRKENQNLRVTADGIERWAAVYNLLNLPSGVTGLKVYEAVSKIRSLSEMQFRNWVRAAGFKYGRQQQYEQDELKMILSQVVLRLASKPELLDSSQVLLFQRKLAGGQKWIS